MRSGEDKKSMSKLENKKLEDNQLRNTTGGTTSTTIILAAFAAATAGKFAQTFVEGALGNGVSSDKILKKSLSCGVKTAVTLAVLTTILFGNPLDEESKGWLNDDD